MRGQRIYARAKDSGALHEESGRVEIRYKPNDGRLYQAVVTNLVDVSAELLPDETCGDAAKVEKATKASSPEADGTPKKARGARKAAGKPADDGSDRSKDDEHAEGHAGKIVAYTDGACTGNPGPAGLGVVVLRPEGRVEVSEYLGQATNNIAELTAVLRAVEEVRDLDAPLVVHTDSQYSIGVLSKGWKAKANTELIAEIRAALKAHRKVTFVYVRGHAGVPLNERCDALAREAIKARKSFRKAYVKDERGVTVEAPGLGVGNASDRV